MSIERRKRFVVGSLCALAAISCGAGEPEGEARGYVLLDSEARLAGASLEVGDRAVTSALPIAVLAADHVALVTGGNEVPITVGRGELVYVEGARARVSHLQIGKQVAIDQLRLSGEEGAAHELASQLGAKVAADDVGWRLSTSDVFASSSTASVPEHLLSAAPIFLNETPVTEVPAPTLAANPIAMSAPIAMTAPNAMSVATRSLFVPAAACEGVGGTWRGRVYSDRHAGYYDFTLKVRQQGTSVTGTVTAEMWTASTDEIEPPSACQGERHATVVERASGSVSADGAMHFNAKSWSVASHVCGERVRAYSPDKFAIALANGATTAHAVVSDEAVWSDGLPLEVTRVSCR